MTKSKRVEGIRRTKIVCTIGPATESPEQLRELLEAGMDVARLNTSHGDLAVHGERIERLRRTADELGRRVAILLDIQGPKVRIGEVPNDRLLHAGERIVFAFAAPKGDEIALPQPELEGQVQPGNTIFLDDGLIELVCEEAGGGRLVCRTVVGGWLKSRKGLTVPGARLDLPALTEADREAIRFGVEQEVDFIAASFVRNAANVRTVREALAGADTAIIAKIENAEGVENVAEILDEADGLMVARGDLGVELPPERVPFVQKQLIAACNRAGKPVVTATQMLDSMTRNPRPTRAEVTDVANAILDGTDAVMLSGETAVGEYPAQAVRVMHKIAAATEATLPYASYRSSIWSGTDGQDSERADAVADAIARATCESALTLEAAAILCSTQSGSTARKVAKGRPQSPILAATPHEAIARRLQLVWGVRPIKVPLTTSLDALLDVSVDAALRSGLVARGDRVVLAAGVRTGTPGSTNLLQVLVV
ncbi:MAG TPA: pyruvate kinase [Limnochordia bacterium]|nr:pyruvate kinase [Limnochordia bacterium]